MVLRFLAAARYGTVERSRDGCLWPRRRVWSIFAGSSNFLVVEFQQGALEFCFRTLAIGSVDRVWVSERDARPKRSLGGAESLFDEKHPKLFLLIF